MPRRPAAAYATFTRVTTVPPCHRRISAMPATPYQPAFCHLPAVTTAAYRLPRTSLLPCLPAHAVRVTAFAPLNRCALPPATWTTAHAGRADGGNAHFAFTHYGCTFWHSHLLHGCPPHWFATHTHFGGGYSPPPPHYVITTPVGTHTCLRLRCRTWRARTRDPTLRLPLPHVIPHTPPRMPLLPLFHFAFVAL